jgi:hypothetical protein
VTLGAGGNAWLEYVKTGPADACGGGSNQFSVNTFDLSLTPADNDFYIEIN